MLRYLSADYIFPVSAAPLKNGVIAVKEDGEIAGVYPADTAVSIREPIEKHKGIIVPGFINSHCHLELSHLQGKLPRAEGLIPFISTVIAQRKADEDLVLAAMEEYDRKMFENGIVAVGDISNQSTSKQIKQKSRIYYHTFVELLGFDPEKAEAVFNRALELKSEFAPMPVSIAPHAPYSVSAELFGLLREYSERHENLTTMHNQESQAEADLFMDKSGGFPDFYKMLNLDLEFFKPRFKSSFQFLLPLFSDKQKLLMVHNTYTSRSDLDSAAASGKDIHWCFCPNANLYIESRLPDIDLFLSMDTKISLGTDSLASNDKLCILAELKTIKEYFPKLPFSQTIRWATLNGAVFLGIDDRYGSIENGKKPGLNLITEVNGSELTAQSGLSRLI